MTVHKQTTTLHSENDTGGLRFQAPWEVSKVELYARVRRAVQVDGMSIWQPAREFRLARKTIRKILRFSLPPGYRRKKPVATPKLGPRLGVVDQILEEDRERQRKQRHTAKRIWQRLKTEHGFAGGYTVALDFAPEARLRHGEVFIPWTHQGGDAQAGSGEALAATGSEQQKARWRRSVVY